MGARGFKILVAERNRLVAEAIRDVFLELAGDHQVSIANSLAAALIIAQRTSPDLLVVGMWLGGHSFEDMIRQLEECSPYAGIMVTTSHVDAELQRRALRAGAIDCVVRDQLLTRAAGIVEQLGAGR
jgi:response regulator of citrate/malate metabolism